MYLNTNCSINDFVKAAKHFCKISVIFSLLRDAFSKISYRKIEIKFDVGICVSLKDAKLFPNFSEQFLSICLSKELCIFGALANLLLDIVYDGSSCPSHKQCHKPCQTSLHPAPDYR